MFTDCPYSDLVQLDLLHRLYLARGLTLERLRCATQVSQTTEVYQGNVLYVLLNLLV